VRAPDGWAVGGGGDVKPVFWCANEESGTERMSAANAGDPSSFLSTSYRLFNLV